jgi:hypothetical protein
MAVRNVLDFGAIGDGTSAGRDTDGIRAAIAACADGEVLLIPRTPAFYAFDTAGGQSRAALVDKRITVRVEGVVRATHGAVTRNPPTIFRVTASDVTFDGAGTLTGSGSVDDANEPDEAGMPSLIRVEFDRFTMRGLTIDTPHKIGVYLWGCHDARIVGNLFTGGPLAYRDTSFFAIRANEGTHHTIAFNQFSPGADGGMYVNCIFFKGTAYSTIDGNVCHRPYEKLCYIAGSYNVVSRNIVIGRAPGDANGGIIPGTNQSGTVGAVYRVDGAYNRVLNNSSQYGAAFSRSEGKGPGFWTTPF